MFTCKSLGRRFTMICGGAAFIIGTVLVASAFHIAQLVVGRLVLGIGVGFATQVRDASAWRVPAAACALRVAWDGTDICLSVWPCGCVCAHLRPPTRRARAAPALLLRARAHVTRPRRSTSPRWRPTTCAARSTSCSSSR
jgi:hypothetical protein